MRNDPRGPKIWLVICAEAKSEDEISKRDAIYEQIRVLSASRQVNAGIPATETLRPSVTVAVRLAPDFLTNRKRRSSTITVASTTGVGASNLAQSPSKKLRLSERSAIVIVTQSEQAAARSVLIETTPITPQKTRSPGSASRRNEDANVRYELPSGTVV